jgi:SPP1 family predicted phage head-tail adaptor
MQAGKLDRQITIERASVVLDGFGGEVRTWEPIATAWAAVMPISDGERWRAGEVAAHVTHRFQVRWGIGVEVADRVLYDGRTFEISGVKEIGRREGQEITAAARAE